MIPDPLKIHKIGKSLKTHGKEGHIRLDIASDYIDDLFNARALFFDLDGSRVPFLIDEIKNTNHLLVRLNEVDTPEAASQLQLKPIFLHEDELSVKPKIDSSDTGSLIGFELKDQNNDTKGRIIELQEFPHQMIATVASEKNNFLLPIHEEMVLDINEDQQWLQIQWPEGIEDI